jgi:2'-5' RNA ligase
LGFKRETAPFKPHLTLARAGSGRPRPVRGEDSAAGLRVVGIQLEGQPPAEFGSMTAREFCLYESKLSSSGAKYTKFSRYPLE